MLISQLFPKCTDKPNELLYGPPGQVGSAIRKSKSNVIDVPAARVWVDVGGPTSAQVAGEMGWLKGVMTDPPNRIRFTF
jgi:hypothetical protein